VKVFIAKSAIQLKVKMKMTKMKKLL